MTIPVPFPIQPGDKLRVTTDRPHGTDLLTGDLVTAIHVGVHVNGGLPIPVVQVSTAHGPQMLTFADVEPVEDLPAYSPAEPDDVVDAFFFNILGADDELRAWAVKARTELAANDPGTEAAGGGTTVAERESAVASHAVGEPYRWVDQEGDELEVTYFEQECPSHGREGGFHFTINEGEEVIIPAAAVDPLVKYLFTMRNHARRPESE